MNSFGMRARVIFSQGTRIFSGLGPLHYRGFTTILRDITIGRTRLDELTACRKRPLPDNTQYSQQTVIPPPPGFELTIPARERLRTRA